jgi:hypothetical protein
MYGVAGFIAPELDGEALYPIVTRRTPRLAHGGPDSSGAWKDLKLASMMVKSLGVLHES